MLQAVTPARLSSKKLNETLSKSRKITFSMQTMNALPQFPFPRVPSPCLGRLRPLLAVMPSAVAALLYLLASASLTQGECPDPAEAPASEAKLPVGDVPVAAIRRNAEREAWMEETLARLDLRQRVAQLVVPWIHGGAIAPGTAEHRRILSWIEEDEVGGLIVSRGPVGEFAPMLNSLQTRARVPLLIVSDLETGPSMRLIGGTSLPPAMAFGAAASEELAREAGRITAAEGRAAGIHLTLGPVLDVNSNPLNPIINTRSFGEDPQEVGRLASAWIAGAREGGLLTAGKHFPGHGATAVDSHIGLPTLAASLAEIEAIDLPPFQAAILAGVDGLLVGHIAVPAFDGKDAPPASLSLQIIQGLLREKLDFDGLVITDALNMGAITRHYGVEEASIRAVLAGADILLQPPGTRKVIGAIVAAVEGGRIPRERIDEAARRVLRAKAAVELDLANVPPAPGGRAPASHERVSTEVATFSITLVRDREKLIPISPDVGRVLHVAYGTPDTYLAPPALSAALSTAKRTVEVVRVDGETAAAIYQELSERALDFDLVVLSTTLAPREHQGPLALQHGFSRFAESVITSGVPMIAISFGSPYLLDYFPSVSTYLLAWSTNAPSQSAAASALLGETSIRGRLPVSLPPHHVRGEGVFRAPR